MFRTRWQPNLLKDSLMPRYAELVYNGFRFAPDREMIQAMADKNGFIMILPDNPGQNCWDVGSNKAMTHDGGGDPHAIAQMVRYAITKYNGDPLGTAPTAR